MGSGPARVLVIIGTRPEAIKLFPVVAALRLQPGLEPLVCLSGQHRDLVAPVLSLAQITPDYALDPMGPNPSLDQLASALLTGLGRVIDQARPARVIVQGDTATAMAGALAAHYRRLPVDHVEAGLRSGDPHHPWPEEAHRKLIAALASLHFAPTRAAAAALHRENVETSRVLVTGNTGIDALHWFCARIAAEPHLAAGLAPLERRFGGKRIVLVTSHRRENWGEGLVALAQALRRLAAREDVAIVFPVHPNPAIRAALGPVLDGLSNVALIEPLDYPHFVRLLNLAHIVLTDSGGVQEEAPALGKPVLVLRETTERPEGVAAGTARLVGAEEERIVGAAGDLLDDPAAHAAMARAHSPYGDGRAAARIAERIAREVAVR